MKERDDERACFSRRDSNVEVKAKSAKNVHFQYKFREKRKSLAIFVSSLFSHDCLDPLLPISHCLSHPLQLISTCCPPTSITCENNFMTTRKKQEKKSGSCLSPCQRTAFCFHADMCVDNTTWCRQHVHSIQFLVGNTSLTDTFSRKKRGISISNTRPTERRHYVWKIAK